MAISSPKAPSAPQLYHLLTSAPNYLLKAYIPLGLIFEIKPIFHCDAKPFTLGPRVGLDPQRHNFVLPIPRCWYLKTLKFALPPMPTPNGNRCNIGCVGSPLQNSCACHVHFYFCVLISFTLGPVFQWNMGLTLT